MEISIKEVIEIFDQLLNQQKSREEVSNWALLRQQAEDNRKLIYQPSFEENRIWKAIIYLLGIDLKDTPHSYLHDFKDINDFRKKINI